MYSTWTRVELAFLGTHHVRPVMTVDVPPGR